ncbi:MAG: ABC transporter permease subunit [Pirellulales bacterium]|nr:ABC transporter permease subunit [Pirellulales bacterium]
MSWTNVKLICQREIRDQLRDRRTLFMIFVLPVLLYPLLGLSFFQVAQFVREQPTKVLILGADEAPKSPPLIEDQRFADELFFDEHDAHLLELELRSTAAVNKQLPGGGAADEGAVVEHAQSLIRNGQQQVVIWFPPGFAKQLAEHNSGLLSHDGEARGDYPRPLVFHNSAQEKSRLAYLRVSEVLDRWRKAIASQNLELAGIDPSVVKPFDLRSEDLADQEEREAAMWSKIFPFLLLIWALTGAFYPAIDLCAGEKERGTLETLLSSPATRSEIVWGKLLTVMSFSIATVVLNIVSMGVSGMFILSQLPQFGPPPLAALFWLVIAVVPVSAMFSALCLALAAFARSTKEGQYYLMPLILVTMPLVVIPMAPGVEMSLGNSLIPITGIVLLLRYLVEGNYAQVLPYVAPVVLVTLLCCLFSIRWAVDQFNTEGVLFRESERLDIGLWVRHLRRDRDDLPTVSQALLCGVLILVIRFFMSFALAPPTDFAGFARMAVITQLVVILTPVLLMTALFTRSPRRTLLLTPPVWWGLPVAALLACLMHPVSDVLQRLVLRLYPISDEISGQLNQLLTGDKNLALMILVIAVVPAICEELAFRGFVLSGFRRMGHKWRAIAMASVFFGLSHAIFQQSLIAAMVGMVIGYLAVQTGSIGPAMLFHMLHNSIALLSTRVTSEFVAEHPAFEWLGQFNNEGAFLYHWPVVLGCAGLIAAIMYWMHRQPYRRTVEEALQEAIDHRTASSLAR